jgi:hypothetical protein
MTPDEIRSHPFFSKLSERKQTFVNTLLTNKNDKIAAAHAAWKCNGDESARTLANRALQDESVAFLVESYFGRDPSRIKFTREQALEFAAKKARDADDDPKLALDYLKLIVQMEGWLVKAADAPNAPAPVDDSNDEFQL